MKIAILSFYGGHLERGIENWTHEFAKSLSKRHKVVVFQNGKTKKSVHYEIIFTNFRVNWKAKDSRGTLARKIFVDYWSLLNAIFTLRILPILWKEKFDIVIPTNGGWQPALTRLLTWIRRGKLVVMGHYGPGWEDKNDLWSFPNIFVARSKYAKEWAKKVNPFVRVEFIPNGVALDRFNPEGKKVNLSLDKPVILTVGAPDKEKRLDLVIKAVAKLKKGSLLVLGGGYEEKKIRNLGEKLLGNKFLMRTVQYNEIQHYYRSADLFTLTSSASEGFPTVYLEALATNLSVVATDDELRREIVGNAGILVDPTDIDAYAKALDKALKTDWGEKPRKQAEKFSWEKVVKQYEELFESLVK